MLYNLRYSREEKAVVEKKKWKKAKKRTQHCFNIEFNTFNFFVQHLICKNVWVMQLIFCFCVCALSIMNKFACILQIYVGFVLVDFFLLCFLYMCICIYKISEYIFSNYRSKRNEEKKREKYTKRTVFLMNFITIVSFFVNSHVWRSRLTG